MLYSGIKKMSNQNAEFASLLKKTPLQLKCQIDPVNIPKVKVYFCHANCDHKAELPVNSMEDSETILYAVSEFQSFINCYNINGRNTFTFYHEMLAGTAHGSWDAAMTPYAAAEDQTHANFLLACNAFLHTFFSHTTYDDLIIYLEAVCKPKKMTKLALATRLAMIQLYSHNLPPSADPQCQLTNLCIKKIYFHMQPLTAQMQYHISMNPHIKTAEVTLHTLAKFFSTMEDTSLMYANECSSSSQDCNNGNNGHHHNGCGTSGQNGRGKCNHNFCNSCNDHDDKHQNN